MSRHSTVIDGHEVVVGWDPPLQTFFGQVYDPDVHEDLNPVVWVGLEAPVPSIAALERELGDRWGAAARELKDRLAADREAAE